MSPFKPILYLLLTAISGRTDAKSASHWDETAALQLALTGTEPPIHRRSKVFYYPLPKYLEVLNNRDPCFAELRKSAEKYALNVVPGQGGILDFQIVESTEPVILHRVWGGPAKRCGYWWTLPHALAIAPDNRLTLAGFMEAMGVCPEWNNGTFLEICSVPHWKFVVGQGNSATCQWGNTLFPPAALLQVNGDVCSQSSSCSTCNLHTEFEKCWARIKNPLNSDSE
mmetsp:Transcript_46396/g.94494  ORF Transcript_46396/g.94494 Transcript_46396/m.94494 type:complete len:226 (-) Transcript_46396:146-823(-)